MQPSEYPRRILLCVTGLTPQIVTETLYALVRRQSPPFIPTEIHIVTTRTGAEQARLSLLYPNDGHFFRLCADYGLDAGTIRFDADTFHIIGSDGGQALDDIRSEDDNIAAADTIARLVHQLTADPQAAVHASIAGGRKTMGFFLGYAMSLFGREQDRLSHVLVPAPFESLGEFYFPPKVPRRLEVGRDRDKRYISTDDAEITLADIPFVRLRDSLDQALLRDGASYSETVARAQRSLEPAELVLDMETRRVRCGGHAFTLPPLEFALLALLARHVREGRSGLSRQQATDDDAREFLAIYRDLPGASERSARLIEREGLTKNRLEQAASKLGSRLDQELGPGRARPYRIVTTGDRARSRYALSLEPRQIRFSVVEETGSQGGPD